MFLHTINPQPIIFQFGFFKLHWYGLIIALATIVGLWLVIKLNEKYKNKDILIFKNKDQIFDLYFYLVIFGLIGARIYEVFLFLPFYLDRPLDVFKVWNGGLAIHGGILAGILIIVLFSKKHKIDFGLGIDLLAPAVALGQAIGRWGNYFNQELFGLPTNLPWGIPIDLINRPVGFESFTYFHPTFLYESLLNLTLAVILIFMHYRHFSKKEIEERQKGNIALLYLIGYSIIRFILEFIKIDETPLLFGLRWPQIISLILMVLVLILFYKKHKKISN